MASRMGNQQNHERIPQEGEVDVLEEEEGESLSMGFLVFTVSSTPLSSVAQ